MSIKTEKKKLKVAQVITKEIPPKNLYKAQEENKSTNINQVYKRSSEKVQEDSIEKMPLKEDKTPIKVDLVICLPGKSFSNKWIIAWTNLVVNLLYSKIKFVVCNNYNPNVYYARMSCLGGDNQQSTFQDLFEGKIKYKHILWIDSDNIPSYEAFKRLKLHNKAIVSGIYHMENRKFFATVRKMDFTFYQNNNSKFQFLTNNYVNSFLETVQEHRINGSMLTKEFIAKRDNGLIDTDHIPIEKYLMKVDYTGMGFMLIKQGVFETIGYPWFMPKTFCVPGSNVIDFMSEDISFCCAAKEKGFDTFVDCGMQIGHEKSYIV